MRYLEHLRFERAGLFTRKGLELLLCAATIVLALAGFVRIVPALLAIPDQIDFGAYYVAARVLNAHGPLYQPDVARAAVGNIHATTYIYPPFWAALLRPLALLPYAAAKTIWLVLNIAFLGLSIALLVRILQLPRIAIIPITGASLLLPATYDTLLFGQVSLLITLLLIGTLACALARQSGWRNDIIAGVLLGIAVAIKVYPAVVGLVFLIHRRIAVLVAASVTVLLTALFGIIFGGGWANSQRWATDMLPSVSVMTPFPSNQSLRAVIARFFAFNQFNVPVLTDDNFLTVTLTPLVDSAILGTIISSVGVIIVLGISSIQMYRRTRTRSGNSGLLIDFALGITAMLLITPVVWDFYLVHLLVSLLVLVRYEATVSGLRLAILAACLLLVLQRYWRWALLFVQSPWLMLFGFLGVLLLWFALIRLPMAQQEHLG